MMQQDEGPRRIIDCRTQEIMAKNVRFPDNNILPSIDYGIMIESTYSDGTTERRMNSCAVLTLYNALPEATRPRNVCEYLSELRNLINNPNINIPDYFSVVQDGEEESIFTKFKNDLNSSNNDLPIEELEGVVRPLAPNLLPNYVIIHVESNGAELVVNESIGFLFYPNAQSVNIDGNTQIVFQQPGHYFGSKLGNNQMLIPMFHDIQTQNIRNDEFNDYLRGKNMSDPDQYQQAVTDGWRRELEEMNRVAAFNIQRQDQSAMSMSQTPRKSSSSAAGYGLGDDDDWRNQIQFSPMQTGEDTGVSAAIESIDMKAAEIQALFDTELREYNRTTFLGGDYPREAIRKEWGDYQAKLLTLEEKEQYNLTKVIPPTALFVERTYFDKFGNPRMANGELREWLKVLGIVWKSKRCPAPHQQEMIGTTGVITISESVQLSLKIAKVICDRLLQYTWKENGIGDTQQLISSNLATSPNIRSFVQNYSRFYNTAFGTANRDSLGTEACRELCILCVAAVEDMEELKRNMKKRSYDSVVALLTDCIESIEKEEIIKTTCDPSQLLPLEVILKIPKSIKTATTADKAAVINLHSPVFSSSGKSTFLKSKLSVFNLISMFKHISNNREKINRSLSSSAAPHDPYTITLPSNWTYRGKFRLDEIPGGQDQTNRRRLGDIICEQIESYLIDHNLTNGMGGKGFLGEDFCYGSELSRRFNLCMDEIISIPQASKDPIILGSVFQVLQYLDIGRTGNFNKVDWIVLEALDTNYNLSNGNYSNINANSDTQDGNAHDYLLPKLILALKSQKHSILAKIQKIYNDYDPNARNNPIDVNNGERCDFLANWVKNPNRVTFEQLMNLLLASEGGIVLRKYTTIIEQLNASSKTAKAEAASGKRVQSGLTSELLKECEAKVSTLLLGNSSRIRRYQPFSQFPIELQIFFTIKASLSLHEVEQNQLQAFASNGYVIVQEIYNLAESRVYVKVGSLSDNTTVGQTLEEYQAIEGSGYVARPFDFQNWSSPQCNDKKSPYFYYKDWPVIAAVDLEDQQTEPYAFQGSGLKVIKLETAYSDADGAGSGHSQGTRLKKNIVPRQTTVYDSKVAKIYPSQESLKELELSQMEQTIFSTWNLMNGKDIDANVDTVSGLFYYFIKDSKLYEIIDRLPNSNFKNRVFDLYGQMIQDLINEIEKKVFIPIPIKQGKRKSDDLGKYKDEKTGRKKRYDQVYQSEIRKFCLNIVAAYSQYLDTEGENEIKQATKEITDDIFSYIRSVFLSGIDLRPPELTGEDVRLLTLISEGDSENSELNTLKIKRIRKQPRELTRQRSLPFDLGQGKPSTSSSLLSLLPSSLSSSPSPFIAASASSASASASKTKGLNTPVKGNPKKKGGSNNMIGGGKLGTYLTIEDKEPFNFIFKEIENEEELNKLLGDYKRNYPSVGLLPFKPINPKLNVSALYSFNPTVTTLTTVKLSLEQGLGNGLRIPTAPMPSPWAKQDKETQSQTQTLQPKYPQFQNKSPMYNSVPEPRYSAVMPPQFVGTVGAGGKGRIRRQTKKRIKHRVTRKRNKGRKIKRHTKYHAISRKPKSRRRKH
jgi:hypothetical protein